MSGQQLWLLLTMTAHVCVLAHLVLHVRAVQQVPIHSVGCQIRNPDGGCLKQSLPMDFTFDGDTFKPDHFGDHMIEAKHRKVTGSQRLRRSVFPCFRRLISHCPRKCHPNDHKCIIQRGLPKKPPGIPKTPYSTKPPESRTKAKTKSRTIITKTPLSTTGITSKSTTKTTTSTTRTTPISTSRKTPTGNTRTIPTTTTRPTPKLTIKTTPTTTTKTAPTTTTGETQTSIRRGTSSRRSTTTATTKRVSTTLITTTTTAEKRATASSSSASKVKILTICIVSALVLLATSCIFSIFLKLCQSRRKGQGYQVLVNYRKEDDTSLIIPKERKSSNP